MFYFKNDNKNFNLHEFIKSVSGLGGVLVSSRLGEKTWLSLSSKLFVGEVSLNWTSFIKSLSSGSDLMRSSLYLDESSLGGNKRKKDDQKKMINLRNYRIDFVLGLRK